MHRTGTTTDNQPVIAGVAQLTTAHGLPLELVLDHFKQRDDSSRRPVSAERRRRLSLKPPPDFGYSNKR
jgi:hypothetical protein